MTRLKQDMDPLGSDSGRSPRRRSLGRSQTGADHISQQEEENLQLSVVANASAEKILNLQEETRMLKEALSKRDDELQGAKILCAKTTSRLSSVEEEVEALRLGMLLLIPTLCPKLSWIEKLRWAGCILNQCLRVLRSFEISITSGEIITRELDIEPE